jgi:micrococcal nuclease
MGSGAARASSFAVRRITFLVLLAAMMSGCSGHRVDLVHQAPATLPQEPPGHERAVVTRVVDGDTIEVRITARASGPGAGRARVGEVYDVRLIGIDTPESVKPGSPVECFAKEASAATAALVDGASVTLVKDVEETDGYGRLLRYVYVGAEMVGARLVANGYAHAYTYPPNVRHAAFFISLQRDARQHDRGLWAPSSCDGGS